MVHRTTFVLVAVPILMATLARAGTGGGYELVRGTVETSGGLSGGGDYLLFSAIHQPIAELGSPSEGSGYSLLSGFLASTAAVSANGAGSYWIVE